MSINEIMNTVDERFRKDEFVVLTIEEWQTLKTAVLGTDTQQLKQAIALVRKEALSFASTSLYNQLDGALVMVEQHACV